MPKQPSERAAPISGREGPTRVAPVELIRSRRRFSPREFRAKEDAKIHRKVPEKPISIRSTASGARAARNMERTQTTRRMRIQSRPNDSAAMATVLASTRLVRQTHVESDGIFPVRANRAIRAIRGESLF